MYSWTVCKATLLLSKAILLHQQFFTVLRMELCSTGWKNGFKDLGRVCLLFPLELKHSLTWLGWLVLACSESFSYPTSFLLQLLIQIWPLGITFATLFIFNLVTNWWARVECVQYTVDFLDGHLSTKTGWRSLSKEMFSWWIHSVVVGVIQAVKHARFYEA